MANRSKSMEPATLILRVMERDVSKAINQGNPRFRTALPIHRVWQETDELFGETEDVSVCHFRSAL